MAEFEVNFPDDFMQDLLETDFDEIAEAALKECAPIIEKSMKSSLQAAVQHGGDSEMVNSVRAGIPAKTKTDAWIINVYPRGYSSHKYTAKGKSKRKYPVSNALKAIWLEYGVAGRQPARPWLAKATNDAEAQAIEKAQQVYNRMVGAE